MVGDLTIQPVFPLASEAKIPLESRSSALRIASKGLMNLLVGEVRKAGEPACGEKVHTGFSTVDISVPTLDRLRSAWNNEIRKMVIKKVGKKVKAMLEIIPLIAVLVGYDMSGIEGF